MPPPESTVPPPVMPTMTGEHISVLRSAFPWATDDMPQLREVESLVRSIVSGDSVVVPRKSGAMRFAMECARYLTGEQIAAAAKAAGVQAFICNPDALPPDTSKRPKE
jgi:hypothetical protein